MVTDWTFTPGCVGRTHCFDSHLTLQRDNVEGVSQLPNDDVIREMSRSLCRALGVSLFGIDVIINNQTGQHAVIDINAFPGKLLSLLFDIPFSIVNVLSTGYSRAVQVLAFPLLIPFSVF